MKLDLKGFLAVFVVFGGMVVISYTMGVSQGEKKADDITVISHTETSAEHKNKLATAAPPIASPLPISASESSDSTPVESLIPEQKKQKFSHFRVGNRNVKGMLADGNLVWVGTSGGVIRYELDTDNYKLFDVSTGSLLSNGVFHLSKLGDKIAVGTYGGGLSLYDPANNHWRNYNIPDGLADQFVYDVQRVANGDVWIATWSGANRIIGGEMDNPEKWETYNVENTQGGLPNDWVYGLEEGKNGEMWFATENGLAKFADGKWENWQHEDGLGANFDKVEKDIKFSRDPGQASRHHAKQKEEQGLSNVNVAFNPNYIVSLVVDSDGIVWSGTWGAGLARFDGKTWTNYTNKEGLPSNHVFMLHKDNSGDIWAGTSHGLAKVKSDGQFDVLTKTDGLYADNVFSMANASDGSIWVGSFGGVSRLYDWF